MFSCSLCCVLEVSLFALCVLCAEISSSDLCTQDKELRWSSGTLVFKICVLIWLGFSNVFNLEPRRVDCLVFRMCLEPRRVDLLFGTCLPCRWQSSVL